MAFEDLAGKSVIVTGAGQGIGEGYARRCAAAGMKVAVADINEEQGRRVADDLAKSGEAMFVRIDVSDAQACIDGAKAVADKFGGIDCLINNAAIFGDMQASGYLDIDLAYHDKFMAVNAYGCLLMTRAVLPYMEQRGGGAIVNQSSTAAWMSAGIYGVAKLAMNGITCSLARELGPRNIRINAIAPGPTDTPALRKQAGEAAQMLLQSMPIARLGTPDDLAGAALFLLSDEARWITGHILNVDGGQYMRA